MLYLGAAGKVNPLLSFSFETTNNSRASARETLKAMAELVLGQVVHMSAYDTAASSAMTGSRMFLRLSPMPPVPPDEAARSPTLPAIGAAWLTDAADTPGVRY